MARNIVKLFSPWNIRDLCFGDICFSPGVPLEEADAALWEYWPDEAILRYQGPKAWYSSEPRWHSQYRTTLVRSVKASLMESEWLHYAHPLPDYRVPHITNCGLDGVQRSGRAASRIGSRRVELRWTYMVIAARTSPAESLCYPPLGSVARSAEWLERFPQVGPAITRISTR